jgi:glucosylceramidase
MSLNVTAFRTSKHQRERLSPSEPCLYGVAQLELELNPGRRFQAIRGFGGAFTEAGGWVLSQLPEARQEEVLAGYFDPEKGLGYSLCRTHINSCDFSLDNYSCCDVAGDTELSTFNIERDEKWLVPFIKRALAVSGARFELLVAPWSPPGWMKTNGTMNGGGKLKPEYREPWAHFIARFIRAYRDRGIPVTMASSQNEPEAVQTWDSCVWTAEEEGQFVAEHLGPMLQREGLADIDILIWDHNRDALVRRASQTIGYPGAAGYIHGTAYHWYNGEQFENVSRVHQLFPDKHLYFTEGCLQQVPHPGAWGNGERYAHHIINDINNWCEGWIDWNMVLSTDGGPNHAGNFCDAPVLANLKTGEVTWESSYWYLGHFSRFVRPGFFRIDRDLHGSIPEAPGGGPGVEVAAFSKTGNEAVAVVLNQTEQPFDLRIAAFAQAESVGVPPRSISTFVLGQKTTWAVGP